MNYGTALDRLVDRAKFRMKPGLHRIEALLDTLAVEDPPRVVTVAGTNGKGTVARLVADALSGAGERVGCFSSPHVLRFTERVTVDGDEIPRDRVVAFVEELPDLVARAGLDDDPPTFFEVTTALALAHFDERGCDAAVLEVGLGGRLDATNAVDADVVAIPHVGLDHVDVLGPTLADVAAEKAATIGPGSVAVTLATDVLDVVRDRAAEVGAEVRVPDRDRAEVRDRRLAGWTVELDGRAIPLHLHGDVQADNLLLAREAVRAVPGVEVDDDRFAKAVAGTSLPARFEVLDADRPVVADGAHNAAACRTLAGTWQALSLDPAVAVLGMLGDKDVAACIDALAPVVREVRAVHRDPPRGLGADDLLARCEDAGVPAARCDGVGDAIEATEGPVLVTGSFGTAGDAARHMTDQRADPFVAL